MVMKDKVNNSKGFSMNPFAMYRLPLRSRYVRGKKYNIVTLEEADKWGGVKVREKCLLDLCSDLDIIFISNSNRPATRLMWRTVHCVIVRSDLQYLPLNVVYQRERFKKPQPMNFTTSGKSIIDLKLSKQELLKTKGIEKYHSITIPDALYRKLKEVTL